MAVVDAVIQERAREAVRILARRVQVRGAYLFGSQVEGTADQWSDVDIAAFVEGAERWDLQRHVDAFAEVQIQVGSDVELHVFPAEHLEHPPVGSFAQYILRHGIRLEIDGIGPSSAP